VPPRDPRGALVVREQPKMAPVRVGLAEHAVEAQAGSLRGRGLGVEQCSPTMTVIDHRLGEQWVLACIERVGPSSVSLFVTGSDGNPHDPGSGTLIRIGDRFLVATAAHVVRGEDLEAIGIGVFERPDWRRPRLLGFGCRGGGEHEPVDVAWLELEPRAIPFLTERRFLLLADLQTDTAHVADAGAFVHGYPAETLEVGKQNETWSVLATSVGFGTVTLGADRLPTRFNSRYDTYVEWPQGPISPGAPESWPKALPSAPGMSGCGIWLAMGRGDEVWTPAKMRMVAIEHSWHEGER
jgi:hypothetical protein